MDAMTVVVAVLFVLVLALTVAVWALARQVGVLFERVSPLGALVTDAGPTVGAAAPAFELDSITGGKVVIGGAGKQSTLLFFASPTCPVCKKLLPILRTLANDEVKWVRLVLASDGDLDEHRAFVQAQKLAQFPYVLSSQLGMTFRVSRLPFAVLIDEQGMVRAKGLVNNREQVESLFNAKELGVTSVQHYLDQTVQSA